MHKVKETQNSTNKHSPPVFPVDGGCEWYICEGFQLVLKKQAEALEALGVCPQMKVRRCHCELYTPCVCVIQGGILKDSKVNHASPRLKSLCI